MVLLQLGCVVMPTEGVKWDHWNYTVLSQPCPSLAWEGWPCSLMDTAVGKLSLHLRGEPLSPALGKDGPISHHRHVPHLDSTLELISTPPTVCQVVV